MDLFYTLVFTVFPYLCLTTFVVGHSYRYVTDRYGWNARSSEFLEKKALFPGSVLFHWGIVFTFLGHAGGLLIPQRLFDLVGIDSQAHLAIAYWSGLAVGLAAFVGVLLLLRRRLTHPRVKAVTAQRHDHHRRSGHRRRHRAFQCGLRALQRSGYRRALDPRDRHIHTRCHVDERGSPQLQNPCDRSMGIARLFTIQPPDPHLEPAVDLFFPKVDSFSAS